jgi:hypothetical protein
MLGEVLDAKAKVDRARTLLIQELRSLSLPAEVVALLRAQDMAQEELSRALAQFQKEQREESK